MKIITLRVGRGVIIKEVSETDISGRLAHAAFPQILTFEETIIIGNCIRA